MKTARALITLSLIAALLTPARAGDPQAPAADADALDLPGRWEPLDGASRGGLWSGFEARFGSGWAIDLDPVTGSPSMLAGPGIPLGAPIEADDAGIARARDLLEELSDVFGVDDPSTFTLERAVSYPNAHGQKMVTINFKQEHRGLDVRHQAPGGNRDHLAMVKLHFNGTLGRLVLLGSDAVPGLRLPEEVRLGEDQALGAALGTAAGPVSATAVRSYVSVRGSRRFLAREAQVGTEAPTQVRSAIFDAHTGELVETRDDLRHVDVTGNVSAGTRVQPAAALVQTPLPALLHTNMTRQFVQARFPAFNGLAGLPVNVNINNFCNAFFIPLPAPSINFFRAGGNCPNTAYLDIVAHEYGHAFHYWFHGWANPGAFSEGIGDHLSLYITGQREFARNGFNNGTPWRDYRAGGGSNQTQYPCINCEVHKGGEVWAGFTMDLRDNLIASRGAGAGIPRRRPRCRASRGAIACRSSRRGSMPPARTTSRRRWMIRASSSGGRATGPAAWAATTSTAPRGRRSRTPGPRP